MTDPRIRAEAARLLRVYGADPARWPGGVDGPFWRAACADPRLQASIAAARMVDDALDASAPASPDEALAARIAASAVSSGGVRVEASDGGFRGLMRGLFPGAPAWSPAAALAAALIGGVVFGMQSAVEPSDELAELAAMAWPSLGATGLSESL